MKCGLVATKIKSLSGLSIIRTQKECFKNYESLDVKIISSAILTYWNWDYNNVFNSKNLSRERTDLHHANSYATKYVALDRILVHDNFMFQCKTTCAIWWFPFIKKSKCKSSEIDWKGQQWLYLQCTMY